MVSHNSNTLLLFGPQFEKQSSTPRHYFLFCSWNCYSDSRAIHENEEFSSWWKFSFHEGLTLPFMREGKPPLLSVWHLFPNIHSSSQQTLLEKLLCDKQCVVVNKAVRGSLLLGSPHLCQERNHKLQADIPAFSSHSAWTPHHENFMNPSVCAI